MSKYANYCTNVRVGDTAKLKKYEQRLSSKKLPNDQVISFKTSEVLMDWWNADLSNKGRKYIHEFIFNISITYAYPDF